MKIEDNRKAVWLYKAENGTVFEYNNELCMKLYTSERGDIEVFNFETDTVIELADNIQIVPIHNIKIVIDDK